MIGIPIVLYQTASILLNFQRYKAQLEGIYNQDDAKHSSWISQFGRENQLKPLQDMNYFAACILAASTGIIVLFQLALFYKSMKIGGEQVKFRLNDLYQVNACLVIPGITCILIVKTVVQIWYFRPYENIFEEIMPHEFCYAILALMGVLSFNQMIGARAGYTESNFGINFYMVIQLIVACLLIGQWSFLYDKY